MITFNDTIKLVLTVDTDGYGDEDVTSLVDLDCLFMQSTGHSHSAHVDVIESDAHAYIDHLNPAVVSRAYRLEGMYVIASLFGAPEDESWYRITRVVIGQRKLADNDIDNVHIYLKKADAQ